jgi:transcriptional regulator with XRE-family HTH domain
LHESFGARLRRRREEQNITLATIAVETKIKRSLLEALERDDVSRWPAGIFRRGYVRAYAHAIGLPPDEVVREFLDLHPDPTDGVFPVATVVPEDGHGSETPPAGRLRRLVASAVAQVFGTRHAPSDPAVPPTGERALAAVGDLAAVGERAAVGECAAADAAIAPAKGQIPFEPDLDAAARLCTALAQVREPADLVPLLAEASRIVDASGLIVWIWNPHTNELIPALTQGYSDDVLAHVPALRPDTENATAMAFRSARICVVDGADRASGAVAVPVVTSSGCIGVLAIELRHGCELNPSVRALITIFAAQLAAVVGVPSSAMERRLA